MTNPNLPQDVIDLEREVAKQLNEIRNEQHQQLSGIRSEQSEIKASQASLTASVQTLSEVVGTQNRKFDTFIETNRKEQRFPVLGFIGTLISAVGLAVVIMTNWSKPIITNVATQAAEIKLLEAKSATNVVVAQQAADIKALENKAAEVSTTRWTRDEANHVHAQIRDEFFDYRDRMTLEIRRLELLSKMNAEEVASPLRERLDKLEAEIKQARDWSAQHDHNVSAINATQTGNIDKNADKIKTNKEMIEWMRDELHKTQLEVARRGLIIEANTPQPNVVQ